MTRIRIDGVGCMCGNVFDGRWYESVNTQIGPEDVEPFLNRELNRFECPKCHKVVWFPSSVLFNDMEREFMVWVGARHGKDPDGFVERLGGREDRISPFVYANDFIAALDALKEFRADPANADIPFREMTSEKSDEFVATFLRLYEEKKTRAKKI